MANSAKVNITATYKDRTKRGMNTTERAVDGLKRQVGALAAAWGIREIALFTVEVSKLAAVAAITERTFANLAIRAGTDATDELNKMRKAVAGTLSDLELMQRVGAAVDAGLTFSQATIALQFLRRYSLAFGKDFNQLVQTIFTGLQRGSVLFLDDAGIILSASDKMFKGLGEVEKKAALVGEAIRLMTVKMEALPEIESNAATEADRLAVAWENVRLAIGRLAESPVASILETLARAATGTANILDRFSSGPPSSAGEFDKRHAAEVQLMKRFAAGGARPGMPGLQIGEEEQRIAKARLKELEAQRQLLQAKEDAAKKEVDLQKIKSKSIAQDQEAIRIQESLAAQEALIAERKRRDATVAQYQREQDAQQQVRLDRETRFEEARQAEAALEAELEADAKRLTNRQAVLDQIKAVEVQASGDQVRIAKHALREQARAHFSRLRDLGATEEQIKAVAAAYKKLMDDVGEEDKIRRILLVFHADASQVRDASDLAAFGMGLLVTKLSELSPAVKGFVFGLEQIMLGLKKGGAEGLAMGVVGAVGIFSTAISIGRRRAEAFRREMAELNRKLEDAADISGQFARSLEQVNIEGLRQSFKETVEKILDPRLAGLSGNEKDLSQFIDADNLTVDLVKLNYALDGLRPATVRQSRELEKQVAQVRLWAVELERTGEAVRRFNGEAFDFRQAIEQFEHIVRLEGISDPAEKLKTLADALGEIGISLDDLSDLSFRDQRRILELVADLNRDVARAEMDARQEQADLVIHSIHEQAARVEDAIDDQMEAQKRAVLRSVRLRFDLEEQALRRSFTPRLTGAVGDPFETARVIQEAQQEIALLQLSEQAASNEELVAIRASFDAAQEENDQATDLLVQAVGDAAVDTTQSFELALSGELGTLSENFDGFLAATSGDITAATHLSRLAILGVDTSVTDMAATVSVDVQGVGASVDALDATAAYWLYWNRAATLDVATKVDDLQGAVASSGDVDQVRGLLVTILQHLDGTGSGGIYDKMDAVLSELATIRQNAEFIRSNTWNTGVGIFGKLEAIETLLATGGGGTTPGSGQIFNFTVDIDIGTIEATGLTDPASIWENGLEAVVVDSLNDGRLNEELTRLLLEAGVLSATPTIPGNIRV